MTSRTIASCLMTCVALFLSATAVAQESRTSESDDRLKRQLERFPEADADKSGVLTLEEWRAFNAERRGRAENREQPERPAPDHSDVAYGSNERHVIDFYLARSDAPTPLVVYFHGGGFVGGDKSTVSSGLVRAMRDAGISVAAVNYRFITTDRFPAPFEDAARAIQFIRAHAAEYNIDPSRIAATGGSAGAGISLWLAFHDDLAEPDAGDPVARQSTRLTCAQVNGAQVSYDPEFWHANGMSKGLRHPSFPKMYGLEAGQVRITDPAVKAVAKECAPIAHLTADDPPAALMYGANEPITSESSVNVIVHHPRHGLLLKERMDALGIECHVVIRGEKTEAPGAAEFLIAHLKDAPASVGNR